MLLTVKKIEKAPAKSRTYDLSDGNALYVRVKPTGGKSFIYRFRRPDTGKQRVLTYGMFPDISLKEARLMHAEAKALIAKGIDPSENKKQNRIQSSGENLFKSIAEQWLERNKPEWSQKTYRTNTGRLTNHVFPYIGSMPIAEISAQNILTLLHRIESKGTIETARRVSSLCSQVFRYAVFLDKIEYDPVQRVKRALPPTSKTKKHRAYLNSPKEIGGLVRALEGYTGHYIVKQALRVGLYTFTRSIEVRGMEWDEIDFENKEWRIPAERMKMKEPHIVPLSRQVMDILTEVKALNHPSNYVFPSVFSKGRILSENTFNVALRRSGYTKEQLCFHGFRATCATRLYEQGWAGDVIERQLAHVERNGVKASYNHATHLEDRRKMMQWLADDFDGLRDGGKVLPLQKTA
ncbi:tyrosine-type recombinase/integrase [Desulfovibrio sp. JC022]|uniref:tyrosine-type recombinase/integrase n=1 Tax=Desulfovibrio sp. JC022 TaxID=2593642 RepID=UPI0013D77EE8|nr:tyrosine-type recombinase/integrase [Desulfovibrio sp. JC022]NDV24432.1 tyrosine-type recombinase/integrase [Desulfovibrio sp. JC022]